MVGRHAWAAKRNVNDTTWNVEYILIENTLNAEIA